MIGLHAAPHRMHLWKVCIQEDRSVFKKSERQDRESRRKRNSSPAGYGGGDWNEWAARTTQRRNESNTIIYEYEASTVEVHLIFGVLWWGYQRAITNATHYKYLGFFSFSFSSSVNVFADSQTFSSLRAHQFPLQLNFCDFDLTGETRLNESRRGKFAIFGRTRRRNNDDNEITHIEGNPHLT